MLSVSLNEALQQNTVGKRKAETSEASGGLERTHDGLAKLREAELSEQHEHSPIHFPFNPSSWRMQTKHVKLCFDGRSFEPCRIWAPMTDLSGSSEAKTTTFAHPLGQNNTH